MSQLFVVTAMYSSGERSSIGPVLRGKLSGISSSCIRHQRTQDFCVALLDDETVHARKDQK